MALHCVQQFLKSVIDSVVNNIRSSLARIITSIKLQRSVKADSDNFVNKI